MEARATLLGGWRAFVARACRLVTAACTTGLFSWPSLARANDAAFGGAGGALVPLQQTSVQMRSETITLSAHDTLERWDIEARYVFFNHGAEPVKVQVGFPELTCSRNEDEMCMRVRFTGLRTRVAGKPVAHRQGALSEHHEWKDYVGTIWLFDVVFPPQQELRIEHSYTTAAGVESSGARFTTYLTRTGTQWAKSIEQARFIQRMPPFSHTMHEIRGAGLKTSRPRIAEDGRLELVAEAESWNPTTDVQFYFNSDTRLEDRAEPADAQDRVNQMYAAKGYPFQSAELRQRYYESGPRFVLEHGTWHQRVPPLEGFTPDWFTPREAQQIEAWKALVVAGRVEPAK